MKFGRYSWDGEHILLDQHALVGAALGWYAFALVLIGASAWLPRIITVPVIVTAVSFVPGMLVLSAVLQDRVLGPRFLVYSFGVSLLSLMLLGLLMNLTLPAVGVDRPLAFFPVLTAVTCLILILAVCAIWIAPNMDRAITMPSLFQPVPLAIALIPVLCILGTLLINRFGNNWLLVIVLIVVAFLPLAAVLFIDSKWHSFGIWAISVGVLYHTTLIAGSTFPGNPVVVRIARMGRWDPGPPTGWHPDAGGPLSTELLQHGTIFPMFALLNDIDIMTQMVVVNPFFVSFIPLVLFLAFRTYLQSKLAFLAAAIFVFSHPFMIQYPTAGRVATPVFFLALFALVITDSEVTPTIKITLAQGFLLGVVFTHYGTSYFVMMALVGALILVFLLRSVDIGIGRFTETGYRTDGSTIIRRAAVLSVPLVAFFIVLTLSWFLLTNAGRGFALFPRHFTRAISQLAWGQLGTDGGRTGARLHRDYGSISIEVVRWIYLFLGGLMAIGLGAALYRRVFRPEEYPFDDEFLTLAVMMLGLFGTTIVIRTWGGGRPMMITFVFTLIFAVVGVAWLASWIEKVSFSTENRTIASSLKRDHVFSVFAVLLVALFLFNSGVFVALGVFNDAPSTTPASDGTSNIEYDIATHVWLIDHNNGSNVYGDHIAHGHTDWVAPAIAAETNEVTNYGPERPRNQLDPLMEPGVGSGYLLVLSHNMETGEFDRYDEYQPIDDIRPEYRQHSIYTAGSTQIYYINTTDDSS